MRNEPEEIWRNMDMKIVNIAKAGSAAFIDDEKS